MYLSEEYLESIRENTNILKVLPEIKIRERNGNTVIADYKGNTIFFDTEKNIYYDINSSDCGDCIDLVMKKKGYSFIKAVCTLRKAKPEWFNYSFHENKFYKINELAASFYAEKLKKSRIAKAYISSRDMSEKTINTFNVGYCNGDGLLSYMQKNDFSEEDLIQCGLLNEKGKEKFRDRILFPIRDFNSRIVGFGGRTVNGNKAKYLNSSDSDIFNKSTCLYNIDKARKSGEKSLIIVEGFMDAVSLYSAGFRNVVACMGTALTEEQATLISLLFKKVYLSQDSDAAGMMAKLRSSKALKEKNIEVYAVDTRPYKDPDEMIKKAGKEAYMNRLKNACDFNSFLLKNPIGKTILEKHEFIANVMLETI